MDINFEQHCPCGDSIKISMPHNYMNDARTQIHSWQNVHTKHANAIAKAIVEAKGRQYTTWPRVLKSTFDTDLKTGAETIKHE